jgi:nucleotidyltransferase/DNA polymerase involved in DNA repair
MHYVQWNSTLAVTYPSRRLYDIKRGDSWEAVAQKSHGKCIGLHLPLLQTGQSSTLHVNGNDVETAYDQIYNLSVAERQQIIQTENGRQRFPSEGKACLERYRLASTRIFGVVLASLEEFLGRGNFILERASIDELFLDVTDYCAAEERNRSVNRISFDNAVENTVRVGDPDWREEDPSVVKLLQRGCWVAKAIRQAVFDKLGFTLSAGISTSKLVAKLGASYGKPNGQAVIYPSSIPFVMNETPIRKVRNLGGKIGKAVVGLLPEGMEPTMGNCRRYLSLPQLSVLGAETAHRVFDNARGIDDEEVKETAGALVKSITAFKSFFQTSLDSKDVINWMNLLATDVISRVKQDMERNSRYPKSCTVHYVFSHKMGTEARSKDRISKSLRITFPKETETGKEGLLVLRAKEAILQREGPIFLHRIGLCAMDFETRITSGGIASFFRKKADINQSDSGAVAPLVESIVKQECAAVALCEADVPTNDVVLPLSREKHVLGAEVLRETSTPIAVSCAVIDRDLELARKLQATYDRENSLLTTMEQRKPAKKRTKINSFFGKSST